MAWRVAAPIELRPEWEPMTWARDMGHVHTVCLVAAPAARCPLASAQELFTTAYIGFLILISTSFVLYLVEKNGAGTKIHTYADALWCGIVCNSCCDSIRFQVARFDAPRTH